ncbi:MAG TPA: hypothetical protein EYG52_05725 [Pseudomonadales bacterium]|jgi:hypothetical protein|nr:hypothetical protein [Gammaproteobacteria bacterium]HIL82998.1 hypothetical protein [Pseudomonadales bacterium]
MTSILETKNPWRIGTGYRLTFIFGQERVADELTQTLDDDSRSAIAPKRIWASGSCYYPIKRYLNAAKKLNNRDTVPTDSANGFASKFD